MPFDITSRRRVFALTLLALTVGSVHAEDKEALKPLPPLVVDLAREQCSIMRPAVPAYEKAADALAEAMEEKTGRRPAIRVAGRARRD